MWNELYKGITLSDNIYAIFSDNVICSLSKHIQNTKSKPESGGLLIGYYRKPHFDIRFITVPYGDDIQKRCYFERRDLKHLEILEKKTNESSGELCYLGEWHSHPENNPNPSIVDLNEWKKIRSSRDYPIVFLIIGIKRIYINYM